MSKQLKPLPKFVNEEQERQFWSSHDSTDYIDWKLALKNPSLPASIRLPESLISDLKRVANKKDVPYQSLVKVYLSQKVREDSG